MAVFDGYLLFLCIKKNIDQNNICASIVLKLKQKKNMKKYFLKVFVSKLISTLFWGSTNFLLKFFSALASKTIDAQMLIWKLHADFHKKKFILRPPWILWKWKLCACAPKIWIWTSKIMPHLWLSAIFYQIKKKSLHPIVEEPTYNLTLRMKSYIVSHNFNTGLFIWSTVIGYKFNLFKHFQDKLLSWILRWSAS